MNNKTEVRLGNLKKETTTFLNYLKAKFPVFHNSNLFFRDVEYGIKGYYEKKGTPVSDSEAEFLTKNFTEHLESESVFIKTSNQAWKVNYPEFVTTKPGDPF